MDELREKVYKAVFSSYSSDRHFFEEEENVLRIMYNYTPEVHFSANSHFFSYIISYPFGYIIREIHIDVSIYQDYETHSFRIEQDLAGRPNLVVTACERRVDEF